MSTPRRIVRKIELPHEKGFDTEFWPVVVAMSVLAAIVIGAILSLLNGIWMWASLMMLPGLVGIALAVLRMVHHRMVRRSLQLGVIFSAALHVLFLIWSCFWFIFSGYQPEEVVDNVPTKTKPIRITFRHEQPVWEQPETETEVTPDPTEKEVEKETTTQKTEKRVTQVNTQSTSQNQTNNQRKSQTNPTVTKFGKTLSKKSRQPTKSLPQTSESKQASAAASQSSSPSSASQPRKTEISRTSPAQSSPQKTKVEVNKSASPSQSSQRAERTPATPSQSQVAESRSQPQNMKPVIDPNPQKSATTPGNPGASLTNVRQRTSQPSSAATVNRKTSETKPEVSRQVPKVQTPSRQPTKMSVARNERSQPKPTPSLSQPTPQRKQTPVAQRPITSPPTPTQPTQKQTNVAQKTPSTRRVEIQRQMTSNVPNQTNPRRSSNPSTNVAERKPMEQTPRKETSPSPSLPQLAKANPQPRRTLMASPQVQSPQNVESPSMAKTSATQGTNQVSPRPLALNKGETGTAGTGSSSNFQRAEGPAVSPAKTASNSSRRSQTQSQPNQTQSLVSKQRSRVNRSITGAPVPQQVVKTNSQVGSVSGTPTPKSMTASASASIQSSSTNQNRGEMSADKGSASIDIGPQKIVADQSSTRTGGGGQPQISQQSANSPSKNSGTGPALQPLVASTSPANSAASPLTQGSAPNQNTTSDPNSKSSIAQRQSNGPITMGNPSHSTVEVAPSVQSLPGTSQQTRSQQSSDADPSIAMSSSQSSDSDSDNRMNRTIANVPGTSPNGSTGQVNSNDPSNVSSSNPSVASGDIQRQSTGTMTADRAERGNLQANNANDGSASNSTSDRRSRASGEQSSEMLVGQTNINRRQLSPNVGGAVGDQPKSTAVAKSSGSGSGSDSTPSKSVNVLKRATGMLPSSNIGPTATRLMAAAASNLPPVRSGRSKGSSDTPSQSDIGQGNSRPNANRTPLVQSGSGMGNQPIPAQGQNSNSTALSGNDNVGNAEKQSVAGMEFDVDSERGPGGLEATPDKRIGINSVRASRQSTAIQPQTLSRFKRDSSSSMPNVNEAKVVAKKAFSARRKKRLKAQNPATAKAIEMGLAFLAKQQNDDGSWSLDKLDKERRESQNQMVSDTAATGLALLAFQGAGFNHKEFYYSEKMNRAVNWMKENQAENGNLYVDGDERSNKSCQLYSHAIATLALCEAYGMTQDPELRDAAQKAIDFIQNAQDPKMGGWRYFSAPVAMRRSDTSVTGWMVMALQSAKLAGLDVKDETFDGIDQFLGFAKDREKEHLFRYNPAANKDNPRTRNGLEVTHSMTSVGLLMKLYTGWDRTNRRMLAGADHLLTRLPDDSTVELRDTYYWYYATQVLNHVGGDRWKKWNDKLEPLLIKSQVQNGTMAGSWDPYYPVADRWGSFGGRIYVTAMNLLNLEVEYRKLPLYEDSGK